MLVHSAFERHLEASYVWDVFIIDACHSSRHACMHTCGFMLVLRTTQCLSVTSYLKKKTCYDIYEREYNTSTSYRKICHSMQEIREDFKFSISM